MVELPSEQAVPSKDALVELSLLTLGSPIKSEKLAFKQAQMAAGNLSVEQFVDELLADPRFAVVTGPEVIVYPFYAKALAGATRPSWQAILKTGKTKSGETYYSRYALDGSSNRESKKCDESKLVEVVPWWDMDSVVKVCPDSYRPERLKDPTTGARCGARAVNPRLSNFCGCGPNLMSCFRDSDQVSEMLVSMRNELFETIGYFIANDLPISSIYTTNATIRDKNVELIYQRWLLHNGDIAQVPDLRDFKKPKIPLLRAESFSGQHAGVLTMPHLFTSFDAPRAFMRDISDMLWCTDISLQSREIDVQDILGLRESDLRQGAGWEELATKPICASCHARLDYASRFFEGQPTTDMTPYYVRPEIFDNEERGKLYFKDHHDLRGESERTPAAFSAMAVEQPEFLDCVAQRTVQHVFGRWKPLDPSVLTRIRRAGDKGSFRSIFRAAALEFVKVRSVHDSRGFVAARAPSPTTLRSEGPELTVSKSLRAQIEEHCSDCHDSGQTSPLLTGSTISLDVASRAIRAVAFGKMPKQRHLEQKARDALVEALAVNLYSDNDERNVALDYFLRRGWAPYVHSPRQTAALIRERSGTKGRLASEEDQASPFLGPTTATGSAVADIAAVALEACTQQKLAGDALVKCLRASLRPNDIVGPVAH